MVIASVLGLGAAALWGGPGWLVGVLGLSAVVGVALWWRAPELVSEEALGPLIRATTELESLAGVRPDYLNTDASARGVLADAARRVSAAGARLQTDRSGDADRHRTLAALLESVAEPIIATDTDGMVLVCNAAAQAILGVSAARLIGQPVEEAFTQPEISRLIGEAGAGRVSRGEVRVPTADGPRIWEVAAAPYGEVGPVGGRRAVVLTLNDATDRSLALQVRTDFVANASHELRTPISAIRAAVETLEAIGPSEAAMHARLVTMLGNHTHRLEELVRDLMDLSKLESPESSLADERVELAEVAKELKSNFQAVCSERKLSIRFDAALEAVQTDRNLLMLILNNLVDNACKFAFEGTVVVVSASVAPGGVRFEVADRGIGIPLGQQQRIFERFFQVDAARTGGSKRGTGLGLSIVKHAVRRLGGSIRVNSVWQQGTTMTVELPLVNGSGERPHPPSP